MTKENKQTGYYKPKYVIVSPVRNEEQFIEKTIKSVISQTVKPGEWIIVNDGSTDNTAQIVKKYTSQYDWIKLLNRKNRGFRKVGGGVIEAFNEGYGFIKNYNFDFVVILDCDLSFERDYFERIFWEFSKDEKIGIVSGVYFEKHRGKFKKTTMPKYHAAGASKVYKKECFDAIGGLVPSLGWDTLDLIRAQMNGWKTKYLDNVCFTHHKIEGSGMGLLKTRFLLGKNSFIVGSNPLFYLLRCAYRLKTKPYIIGGVVMFLGFFISFLRKEQLIVSKAEKNFYRQQQKRRLSGLLTRLNIYNYEG